MSKGTEAFYTCVHREPKAIESRDPELEDKFAYGCKLIGVLYEGRAPRMSVEEALDLTCGFCVHHQTLREKIYQQTSQLVSEAILNQVFLDTDKVKA